MSAVLKAVSAPANGVRYPLVLGIDPGLSGGWAWLDADGKLLDAQPMPTITVKVRSKKVTKLDGSSLAEQIKQAGFGTTAFVEAVSSRPRQAGQFQFGINTGVVHGILYAHRVPFQLVAPATWKSVHGIKRAEDETKAETKTQARILAAKLFPQHARLFARVKDDGVAEAVLIALYGLFSLSQR